MAPLSVAGILKELDDVVGDQLQVVTYKWLGRRYNVPYDTAKRILFEFVTRHPQKVKATFLLSGWAPSEDGAPERHVVRVVEGQQLEAEKAKLDLVTGMHVYSVQPGVPKDASDLFNTDYAQTMELFQQLLASSAAEAEGNPMASNLLNAVQCPGVRFDPALAARRPRPPPAAPAPASGRVAMAAAAAGKPAAQAAALPAQAAAKSPPGKPSGGAGKRGSPPAKKSGAGGTSMAAMWSKAEQKSKAKAAKGPSEAPAAAPAAPPSKRAAQEQAGQQQGAAKGKVQGKASVRPAGKPAAEKAAAPLPASDDSWEDSEEEEDAFMAVGRNKAPAGKKSRQLLEESESEGEGEAPPAKRGKASKAVEDDGKKEAGGKKAAGGGKRKKPAKGGDGGDDGGGGGGDEREEEAPAPAGPKWGNVKVRDPEPGAKRVRREMRTFYNDAGEEVTELVEVEEEAPPSPAQQQQPQQQQQQQQQPARPAAAAPKPAPKPAARPAAGSGGSKKGGKGAPPPGQKGIMSFFGKK